MPRRSGQQNITGCFETNRKFESYIIKYVIHKKKRLNISEVNSNAYHKLLAFIVVQLHRDHILTDNFCYPCELLSL